MCRKQQHYVIKREVLDARDYGDFMTDVFICKGANEAKWAMVECLGDSAWDRKDDGGFNLTERKVNRASVENILELVNTHHGERVEIVGVI